MIVCPLAEAIRISIIDNVVVLRYSSVKRFVALNVFKWKERKKKRIESLLLVYWGLLCSVSVILYLKSIFSLKKLNVKWTRFEYRMTEHWAYLEYSLRIYYFIRHKVNAKGILKSTSDALLSLFILWILSPIVKRFIWIFRFSAKFNCSPQKIHFQENIFIECTRSAYQWLRIDSNSVCFSSHGRAGSRIVRPKTVKNVENEIKNKKWIHIEGRWEPCVWVQWRWNDDSLSFFPPFSLFITFFNFTKFHWMHGSRSVYIVLCGWLVKIERGKRPFCTFDVKM